jgi:hypothetical protein
VGLRPEPKAGGRGVFCPLKAVLVWALATRLFASGFAPPDASLVQIDVTGTWDLRVETSGGVATPSVTFKQESDKITGIYRGRMGESKLEGTLRANKITFSVHLQFQDQPTTIIYSGTVEKDMMKGTARFDGRGSASWTGKRR